MSYNVQEKLTEYSRDVSLLEFILNEKFRQHNYLSQLEFEIAAIDFSTLFIVLFSPYY